MLDMKFVRENPDVVKENIKKKFQEAKLPLVDEVLELDAQNRAARGSLASWNFFLIFSLTTSGFSRTNFLSSMVDTLLISFNL